MGTLLFQLRYRFNSRALPWRKMRLGRQSVLISPRSHDSISHAKRQRRAKLPESAQCDSNTISCAVALCFRFFFPFLRDIPKSFQQPENEKPIARKTRPTIADEINMLDELLRGKSLWFVLAALRHKLINQSINRKMHPLRKDRRGNLNSTI